MKKIIGVLVFLCLAGIQSGIAQDVSTTDLLQKEFVERLNELPNDLLIAIDKSFDELSEAKKSLTLIIWNSPEKIYNPVILDKTFLADRIREILNEPSEEKLELLLKGIK